MTHDVTPARLFDAFRISSSCSPCLFPVMCAHTYTVWQKLEEQNPEFFTAYKMRLRLQDQIRTFNQLLEQHMQMSNQSRATQLNAAYGWGAGKMPAGARSGVSPGIPSSYNYMMGGSGISASHRGSWGHLAQLDASGMGEVRLPGSDASYMSSLAQTSSTGNLQGMMLGGAGMPMSDQMNSGYIGSFNDASNPQLPRAIPRNLSLGDMSFEMNNQSINQLSGTRVHARTHIYISESDAMRVAHRTDGICVCFSLRSSRPSTFFFFFTCAV